MPYPWIDDALAAEVLRAIGADRAEAVETIVHNYRSWLPAGSTAKWAAVDSGRVPPGADPRTGIDARLGGSHESWSCWVLCTGRYRMLGDRLDRRDVDAFCQVSVTHSGVGRRRYAHWLVGPRLCFVREADDGVAELRVTEGDDPFRQRRRLVDRGPHEELRTRIDDPTSIEVTA